MPLSATPTTTDALLGRVQRLKSLYTSGLPGGGTKHHTHCNAIFQFDDIRFVSDMQQEHGTPVGQISNIQHYGLVILQGLKLVDSGAEVNIEVDLTKFVGYIEPSTVTIAMADGKSRLDNRGYGLCRDWYLDTKGNIFVDEYYAFYCPNAAYSIRSQHALARDAKGTIVLDPLQEQTIQTALSPVKVSGTGMFLCTGTGQAVECVKVQQKSLHWLKSLPPTKLIDISNDDSEQSDGKVPGEQPQDVSTAQIINALSQRFTDIPRLMYLSDRALREEAEAVRAGKSKHHIDPATVLSVQKAFRMDASKVLDKLTETHQRDDQLDMSLSPAQHQKQYQSIRAQIEQLTREIAHTYGTASEELELGLNALSSCAASLMDTVVATATRDTYAPPTDHHLRYSSDAERTIINQGSCSRCGRRGHHADACVNACSMCNARIGHDYSICSVANLGQSFANLASDDSINDSLEASMEFSLGIASANASMLDAKTCDEILTERYDLTHEDLVPLANALQTQYGLDFSYVHGDDGSTILTSDSINQYEHLVAVAVKLGGEILAGDDPLLAAPAVGSQNYVEYRDLLPQHITTLYSVTAVIASAANSELHGIDDDLPDSELTEAQLAAISAAEKCGATIHDMRILTQDYLHERPAWFGKDDDPERAVATQSAALRQ